MRRGQHPTSTTGRFMSSRPNVWQQDRQYRDSPGKPPPYQRASASAKALMDSAPKSPDGNILLRSPRSFRPPPRQVVEFTPYFPRSALAHEPAGIVFRLRHRATPSLLSLCAVDACFGFARRFRVDFETNEAAAGLQRGYGGGAASEEGINNQRISA
jgi:hypothetical protein